MFANFTDKSLPRDLISVSGEEANDFLQAIITNDINKVTENNSIYSCLLSPQGKYNFDFFISLLDNKFYIDVSNKNTDKLIKRLNLYKLRRKIQINLESDFGVLSLKDEVKNNLGFTEKYLSGIKYVDPRKNNMFYRAIINKDDLDKISEDTIINYEQYTINRINNIIAEGESDLISDKSFPLEWGIDKLNGIDFNKGCYVGQEVTSRTKYRGVIRKEVYKITSDFDIPENSEIYFGEVKIGMVASLHKNTALALIREEDYKNLSTTSSLSHLYPRIENHKINLYKDKL